MLTLTGAISGSGALIKSGGGTLTLNGANSYSGCTTLTAGTLTVGYNQALGTGALAMAAGTTLGWVGGSNFTVAKNIAISGDPFFAAPAGTTQTLSGVIANGGTPGTLEMQGPGTLVLGGINTYTVATNINGGTLALGLGGSIAASSGGG